MSDLVGEFPELQGNYGWLYFPHKQGFDKEICLAVSEQYLPSGLDSQMYQKNHTVLLYRLSDKIDNLSWFFWN